MTRSRTFRSQYERPEKPFVTQEMPCVGFIVVATVSARSLLRIRHTSHCREYCSHLQGMWYRTLKMVESGIKPVYVFEGKPPTMKNGTVRDAVLVWREMQTHFLVHAATYVTLRGWLL